MKFKLNLMLFGGRGGYFHPQEFKVTFEKDDVRSGKVLKLNVVGLTPYAGNKEIRRERSLDFLENYHTVGLKHEQAFMVNRQGYVTDAFKGDSDHVDVYLNKKLDYSDYIMTHNHPSHYGGGFSEADIRGFKYLESKGFNELRASSHEGTWSLKKTTKKGSGRFNPEGFADYLESSDFESKTPAFKPSDFSTYLEFKKEERRRQLLPYEAEIKKRANDYGLDIKFKPYDGDRQRLAWSVDNNDVLESRKEYRDATK